MGPADQLGLGRCLVDLCNLWVPPGSTALGCCYFMEKVLNIVLVCCWRITLESGRYSFQLLAEQEQRRSYVLWVRPFMFVHSCNIAGHLHNSLGYLFAEYSIESLSDMECSLKWDLRLWGIFCPWRYCLFLPVLPGVSQLQVWDCCPDVHW